MPHPIPLGSGTYHLNVRVPADIAAKLRGTCITLPVGDESITVGIRDKVIVSLRTKDPRVAKDRFAQAHAALTQHWRLVRSGPEPLTQKQVAALAGVYYRQEVADQEADHTLTPEALQAEEDERRAERDGLRLSQQTLHLPELTDEDADRVVTDLAAANDAAARGGASRRVPRNAGEGAPVSGALDDVDVAGALLAEVTEDDLRIAALMHKRHGPAVLAYRARADLAGDAPITYEAALDQLFGPVADRLCQRVGVNIDGPSRSRLLREIGEAQRQAEAKLLRNMQRDWSDDPAAARFPAFVPPPSSGHSRPPADGIEGVADLYRRWSSKQADKKSPATIRRYGPSLMSLDRYADGRDWRTLTSDDIYGWALKRCADGVAPETVNRNDLVAASSVLGWATTVNGKRRTENNVAFGVKVEASKRIMEREKFFRADEIRMILRLARSAAIDPKFPRASASRRWVPWICAYSGARVQEPLWLKKSDVRMESGVPVLCFSRTKDGWPRMVPIHQALIDEGFLDFVSSAPGGWLFVGDTTPREGATRTPQEMRAAELTHWVRSNVNLHEDLSPSHAWRHTFITYAENRIAKRFLNRITGHNMEDVSGRYVGALVTALATEMAKFPRYEV